jgi:hypothetical protein
MYPIFCRVHNNSEKWRPRTAPSSSRAAAAGYTENRGNTRGPATRIKVEENTALEASSTLTEEASGQEPSVSEEKTAKKFRASEVKVERESSASNQPEEEDEDILQDIMPSVDDLKEFSEDLDQILPANSDLGQ